MRMFVPGSNSTSASRQHVSIRYPDKRVQLTENRSLRRRPKRGDLRSGVPRRDKVENPEPRSEWRCVDSAVVRASLLKPEVHRYNENRCENHYNSKGCSKGYDGGGHSGIGCGFSNAGSDEGGDVGRAT